MDITLIRFVALFFANQPLLGLSAPLFAWLAAVLLPLWAIYEFVGLRRFVAKETRLYRALARDVQEIRAQHSPTIRHGTVSAAYDKLAALFASHAMLVDVWQHLDSSLIRRQVDNDDRFWRTIDAGGVIPLHVHQLPRSAAFYGAFPGLLTGVGLLTTFLAILVALKDVTIANNQVQGLDNLISGLSGKFIASICALASASLFLVFEKRAFFRLDLARRAVTTALDRAIPYVPPSQLLADIREDIAAQALAFRHFDSDLSIRLRQGVHEGVTPTLERMILTIEELARLLRAAEEAGQNTRTTSFDQALQRLETSITSALSRMTADFTETLSGATRTELERVASSLGTTAELLASLGRRFEDSRSAVSELVQFARTSTADQLAAGKSQVEELTDVLRTLMAQLKDSAGESSQQMLAAIGQAVAVMSQQMTAVQEQVARTVTESTGHATSAVENLLSRTDEWSTSTSAQLAALLERHRGVVDRVDDMRNALETTLARLKDSVAQYVAVNDTVRSLTDGMATCAGLVRTATDHMQRSVQGMERVSNHSADQLARLDAANRHQDDVWQRIQSTMRQYQQTFVEVETAGAALLEQIARNLHAYTQTSASGFEQLVKVSDGFFRDATTRLGGTVNGLEEHLQALEESVEHFRAALDRLRPSPR